MSELDITGDDSTQLAIYKEKFPVLWENSAVKGVTLWGYIQGQTWISNTHLLNTDRTERPPLQWLKQYFSGFTGGGTTSSAYADFESGTDGWTGSNIVGGPWSTTAWSSKNTYSLQVDIAMTANSQHTVSKIVNANFSGHTKLKATVHRSELGGIWYGIRREIILQTWKRLYVYG